MFKRIVSFCLLITVVLMTSVSSEAASKSKKTKKKSQKTYKVSKHKRKSRHYKKVKRGTGPDLKTITTESPYTEETNNGVNQIETK